MRTTVSTVSVSLLVLSACATMNSNMSPSIAESGIAQSVFPLYVKSPSQEDMNKQRYQVTAAICVAPNLSMTSSLPFLTGMDLRVDNDGASTTTYMHMYDMKGLRIEWNDGAFDIKAVEVMDNLAFLTTEQACTQIELLERPVQKNDRYITTKIRFGAQMSKGHLPNAEWDIGGATVISEPISAVLPGLDIPDHYTVRLESPAPNYGTPLIDRQNRLVGLLHSDLTGNRAKVMSIRDIRAAMETYWATVPQP